MKDLSNDKERFVRELLKLTTMTIHDNNDRYKFENITTNLSEGMIHFVYDKLPVFVVMFMSEDGSKLIVSINNEVTSFNKDSISDRKLAEIIYWYSRSDFFTYYVRYILETNGYSYLIETITEDKMIGIVSNEVGAMIALTMERIDDHSWRVRVDSDAFVKSMNNAHFFIYESRSEEIVTHVIIETIDRLL